MEILDTRETGYTRFERTVDGVDYFHTGRDVLIEGLGWYGEYMDMHDNVRYLN